MVAILNFMYHGEVNVNQEDLQMFLAAAEELRIKGLSQASNDGKLEKLDVPKKKLSVGAALLQPPTKRAREGSPGGSPASSGPGSARSPTLDQEDGEEGPQLTVKREFASGRDNPSRQEAEDDDSSQGQEKNLLDQLMQVTTIIFFRQILSLMFTSVLLLSSSGWSDARRQLPVRPGQPDRL